MIALLGALAVLSAVSYLLVFAPKIREVRRLQEDVEARQAETGNALRVWGRMTRTAGAETLHWEEQLKTWREKVPDAPEEDALMADIGRLAVLHNLKGFRLSIPPEAGAGAGAAVEGPGATASAEGTEEEKHRPDGEIRYRLSFLSTYRDMAGLVDAIPARKRLLAIRSIAVRERDGEMETTMELSAFYRKAR
jgi:hypothetical protein